jgi:hypothetical protein
MKKVPLYTLNPDELCAIQGKTMIVTSTKKIHTEGDNSYQQIYLKEKGGRAFLHAPAGLIVTKID